MKSCQVSEALKLLKQESTELDSTVYSSEAQAHYCLSILIQLQCTNLHVVVLSCILKLCKIQPNRGAQTAA